MSHRILAALVVALLPVAVAAQDTVPAPDITPPGQQAPMPEMVPDPGSEGAGRDGEGSIEDGMGLIQEGGRQILRGLQQQLGPMIEDFTGEMEPKLKALVDQLGPLLQELAAMIDDFTLYEAPERLPNGDILIPRRHPEELTPPPSGVERVPEAGGQIDL